MNLSIHVEEQKHQITLYVKGEVDVYTVSALKNVLYPCAEKEERSILLDLQHVEYMDNSGLKTMIGAMKIAHAHTTTLSIINANKHVKRLLHITGLSNVIEIRERGRVKGHERTGFCRA